ncbi:universal stress protein [Natronomonas sp. F2-12]|jgi:nucleotide-binding universal stress UspA family protein|uniref:Universal stress protein n=1 Tax=Natronomonas aquatica TaxID=2841590 RepID=A0A9R1CS57_9EURY|nr:universal stress protein [Natronomonas aquatica]MCQ4332987.1 universal stress protein [Natronomonas aquatica]
MDRSVLVPMDDSPPSRAALEHALSSHPDAEITVLYVVDTTHPVGYGDLFTLAAHTDHGAERSEELFEEAEQLAEEHGVELITVTEQGVPARTIAGFADEQGIDHVVMGSHCRTGVNRLFLGSVAERVVRRTSVPVTVVP